LEASFPEKGRVAEASHFGRSAYLRSENFDNELATFPHFRSPPWLFPRLFDLTAIPFAVTEDIAIQEKALQHTLRLSPHLFAYTWTAA
jgi:hypothetical protein